MSPYWETLVALPARGKGVTVSTTPTQVLAATAIPGTSLGRPIKQGQVPVYNDDASNSVTLTAYLSDETDRANGTPQTVTVGPQSMDRLELADVADKNLWLSATSSAGTAQVRVAVLLKDAA